MEKKVKRKILFPKVGEILHGGDYNPEQWLDRPDILAEDIRLMKKAGVNCVTLGVFSWAAYEPSEGEFHFAWLQDIMDNLYENGIYTILATPSGARPAWLDAAYPDAMRVSKQDVRSHHGIRHNHCMSSLKYREKVRTIDQKLAEKFGSHPGILMWHISNEFGGECYCPACAAKFRRYLAERFDHDISKLNHAWWTAFWSHTYASFEQIEPPYANGEKSVMGLNLEWKRFTTWNTLDFMKQEIQTVKEIVPEVPVTTNFMTLYNGLDYRAMADFLDVISWDSYPRFHNEEESLHETFLDNAFHHALMRSLKKDTPFMLMESAPGCVNWQTYNKMRRPGIHELFCMQAVACGSDTVQYFQWRKGRGSFEQYHGAVVDHLGTDDTRIFREVAETGRQLKKLTPVAGSVVKARAALLFDWDNRWAIQDVKALSDKTKNYEKTCMSIWKEFCRMGVEMDIVGSEEDLSDYSVVVAPMLYLLRENAAAHLKKFVAEGGQLLATYFTGYVDENLLCFLGGFPGNGMSEVFGVISEEIDTLYPSDRNGITFAKEVGWKSEGNWEVRDYAEVLRVRDAQVLGTYTEDYYKDCAALTCKEYGKGKAYYMAARVEAAQMQPLFAAMLGDAGILVRNLPENVEFHVRTGEEERFEFYLNHSKEPVRIAGANGVNLLTGEAVSGELVLAGYGAAVLRQQG